MSKKKTCGVVIDEQGTECGMPAVATDSVWLAGTKVHVDVCLGHKSIINENAASRRVSARTAR